MRSRRKLCGQANVRSTTQRTRPSPEPCSVLRRAITGLTPRRHSSRRYLSWVIAAIGDQPVRSPARPTAFARDRADPIDEGQQLRDVIAMATGQRCGQRHAVTVDDQVVLGTSAGAVDRRTAGQRTTTKRADVAAVHYPGLPVEPPEGVEPPEQLAMQPIPYAGRLP